MGPRHRCLCPRGINSHFLACKFERLALRLMVRYEFSDSRLSCRTLVELCTSVVKCCPSNYHKDGDHTVVAKKNLIPGSLHNKPVNTVGLRPTWAEIDLDSLAANLRFIRRRIGS